MNREKEDQLPLMQVGFIDSICLPIYEVRSKIIQIILLKYLYFILFTVVCVVIRQTGAASGRCAEEQGSLDGHSGSTESDSDRKCGTRLERQRVVEAEHAGIESGVAEAARAQLQLVVGLNSHVVA